MFCGFILRSRSTWIRIGLAVESSWRSLLSAGTQLPASILYMARIGFFGVQGPQYMPSMVIPELAGAVRNCKLDADPPNVNSASETEPLPTKSNRGIASLRFPVAGLYGDWSGTDQPWPTRISHSLFGIPTPSGDVKASKSSSISSPGITTDPPAARRGNASSGRQRTWTCWGGNAVLAVFGTIVITSPVTSRWANFGQD